MSCFYTIVEWRFISADWRVELSKQFVGYIKALVILIQRGSGMRLRIIHDDSYLDYHWLIVYLTTGTRSSSRLVHGLHYDWSVVCITTDWSVVYITTGLWPASRLAHGLHHDWSIVCITTGPCSASWLVHGLHHDWSLVCITSGPCSASRLVHSLYYD